ncbi:major facilitator superfamily domain-containing protein [Pelagophyceae sp. CCMP2097]|nr:major facilitator superfamily domain-containing protein [Pelagophyceae sp. CCMP2097]
MSRIRAAFLALLCMRAAALTPRPAARARAAWVGRGPRGGAAPTSATPPATPGNEAATPGDDKRSQPSLAPGWGAAAEAPGGDDGQKWRVLGALVFAYVSNQWCRSVLFSTVSFTGSEDAARFLNVDLGISQSQYALLSTLAFNALFSLCSIAAGALADTLDGGVLTAGSCAVWSLATLALSQAAGFGDVAACRAVQGIAMAATAPAGYTLIAKNFDASQRARANSAYASAVAIGGALASASVVLDEAAGWRATFIVAGASGLAVAAFAAIVLREPAGESAVEKAPEKAAAVGAPEGPSLPENLAKLFGDPVVVAIYATTALRFCAGFAIGVWALPCFRAQFPLRASEFGVLYAGVVGGCGALSALLGGFVADAAADRAPAWLGDDAARALVPAAACLVAAPLWVAAVSSSSFEWAVALVAVEFLVAECWIGPTTALLQSVVAPESRGTAQGVFTSLTLVGNVAPLAIGALSDRFELTTLVSGVVGGAYVASSAGFIALAVLLPRRRGDAVAAES